MSNFAPPFERNKRQESAFATLFLNGESGQFAKT